jgi:hypothetical protein
MQVALVIAHVEQGMLGMNVMCCRLWDENIMMDMVDTSSLEG